MSKSYIPPRRQSRWRRRTWPWWQQMVASAGVLLLCLLLQLTSAAAASAAAPSSYGWWTQNPFSAIGPTVPPDGMFVENAPTGSTAISALTLDLPSGTVADGLTLNISGPAVITRAPVACAATSPYQPAQGGAWSDRPNYDCASSVTGVVNAGNTQVQFLVAGLEVKGSLSVVILAGGPTDRIAFVKPGPDAVSLKAAGASPPPPATAEPSLVPTTGPALPSAAAPKPVTPAPSDISANPTPSSPDALVAPQPSGLGPVAEGPGHNASTRRRVGTSLGVALLLLSVLYWIDGFGTVPLRSWLATRDVRRGHA